MKKLPVTWDMDELQLEHISLACARARSLKQNPPTPPALRPPAEGPTVVLPGTQGSDDTINLAFQSSSKVSRTKTSVLGRNI